MDPSVDILQNLGYNIVMVVSDSGGFVEDGKDMGSGARLKEVRAVYYDGMLRLLDELELPDGVQVRLLVEAVHPGDTDQAAEKKIVYPTRVIRAERLDALTGLLQIGGDALADSEALYDPDRD